MKDNNNIKQMKKITDPAVVKQYYDFISNIYSYDVDNHKEYEKVEGLMEAMRNIHKSCSTRDIFLMKCIIKEINKVCRKRKKSLVEQK